MGEREEEEEESERERRALSSHSADGDPITVDNIAADSDTFKLHPNVATYCRIISNTKVTLTARLYLHLRMLEKM